MIFSGRLPFFLVFLAIIAFITGTTIAMFQYPHYSFSHNYLSDLAVGSTAMIFNLTLLLTIFLFLPFFYYFYLFLRQERSRIFFLGGMIFAFFSLPFLIGVLIYDIESNAKKHLFFTRAFYTIIGLSIILWAIGLLLIKPDSTYRKWKLPYFEPYLGISIIIIDNVLVRMQRSLEPLVQKLTIYLFLLISGYIAFKVLQINKEMEKNSPIKQSNIYEG